MDQRTNDGEEFRRQPPAPLAPRQLNLPEPSGTTLANGMRVVIVETDRLPLVSFRLALRTGDAYDPPGMPGLTDVLAHLLSEGTESRTSRQIADEVARLGAALTAGANSDYTTVAASALSSYGDEILELLADVALRPTFPEGELELAKQNTLQNLIAQRAQASFLASERMARVMFGRHPYSVISPTPQSIGEMTREQLVSFHRAMFIPNNAVLFAVGAVKRGPLLARVEDLFGSWGAGQIAEAGWPEPPEHAARAVYLVDRPGSEQSNIVIANRGITRTHPDYFPLLLMHTVLGANASSRLFMNLREDKGYTYGAYTSLDARRFAGTFRATAEVRTAVTGDSLKEFFYEFGRIRQEDVSEKELTDAKSYLTGIFPVRLETQEGLIDQLVQMKMYDLPEDYLRTYQDRVQAVTREEVRRAAERYVLPDKSAIVIVGDAKAIAEQAGSYAEHIEFYDSAGNRRESSTRGVDQMGVRMTDRESINDVHGTWRLEVMTPFGQHPATLSIERSGDALSGNIKSQMGDAPLSDIKINWDGFDAKVSLTLQGRTFGARIAGRVEGNRLDGTINVQMPIAPTVRFTGTRVE